MKPRALAHLAVVGGVAATCTLMTGCGNLNVSVDVLDPGYVQQEMADESLRKLYREIAGATPGDFAARVDRQFSAFRKNLGELGKRLSDLAATLPPSARQDLERSIRQMAEAAAPGGQYSNDASRQGTKLETLAQTLVTTAAELGYGRGSVMPAKLREQLVAFQAAERSLRMAQINDVRAVERNANNLARATGQAQAASAAAIAEAAAPAAAASAAGTAAAAKSAAASAAAVAPQLNALQQQAAATVATVQRSIIGDGSLAATEYAYAVANAPDGLWKRDFNRAFANGTLGNVDVVIRLNSTADFSVKGLLFDASKVAQVASKVMTQAVLLGAQMSGVPVPTASTGTTSGGDALSKSSADLATADAALARRQAQVAAQKDAIRSLARSLLAVTPALTAAALKDKPREDPERMAVHQGIDTSFTALRALLAVQDLQ